MPVILLLFLGGVKSLVVCCVGRPAIMAKKHENHRTKCMHSRGVFDAQECLALVCVRVCFDRFLPWQSDFDRGSSEKLALF